MTDIFISYRRGDAAGHAGRRRLDDPNDFVRLEVGEALARNVSKRKTLALRVLKAKRKRKR